MLRIRKRQPEISFLSARSERKRGKGRSENGGKLEEKVAADCYDQQALEYEAAVELGLPRF